MTASILTPLIVAVLAALTVAALHRRLHPHLAAAALTAALAGTALATVPVLAAASLGFVAHLPGLHGAVEWCRHVLGLHASVEPWFGVPALMLGAFAGVRVTRVIRAWRSLRRAHPGAPELVDSDSLFAFSLPGPGGRVALSTGLVGALDPDELAAVMAHERGHTANRHDRHLLVADVAVAVMPLVEPLRRRLRFALERWADETAVATLGGDRDRVARTLARVAISHADSAATLPAFNGLGVTARVEALLRPPSLRHHRWWLAVVALATGVVMGAAAIQAHHVAAALRSLCPG